MIRMLIVGYCFGIRSERRLEEVNLNLAYRLHEGTRTEGGWHFNIRVGVQYIEAHLQSGGRHGDRRNLARADLEMAETKGVLDNGTKATPASFEHALDEEMDRVKREISLAPDVGEFLTLPAYKLMD